MVKTDFGTSGETTMIPGECELTRDSDIDYWVDENDEITWIELQGGDEPLKFEPPLTISFSSHSYGQRMLESRIETWLEMMIDQSCKFDVNKGIAHTSELDFNINLYVNESGRGENDVYWNRIGEWPEYGDDLKDSLQDLNFDFWESDWGRVYEDYENKTVLVESEGAPPAAIVAVENGVPGGISVGVSGWVAKGEGYCNKKWCSEETSDNDYCFHHGSEVALESIGHDVARSNGESDDGSVSLEDKLNEVADEIGQKRVEEMDQRAVEYMRENREVFKAEIVDISYRGNDIVNLKLDIPTVDGHTSHHLQLPDENGSYSGDGRTREVMNYLGVNLRELHMVEGMYLPVTFSSGRTWEVYLPGQEESDGLIDKVWSYRFLRDGVPIVSGILALLVSVGVAIIPGIQYTPVIWMFYFVLLNVAASGLLPLWGKFNLEIR